MPIGEQTLTNRLVSCDARTPQSSGHDGDRTGDTRVDGRRDENGKPFQNFASEATSRLPLVPVVTTAQSTVTVASASASATIAASRTFVETVNCAYSGKRYE